MIPLRSFDPSKYNYRRINQLAAAAEFARNEAINLRHATTASEGPDFDDAFMHPFRIYSYPSGWRASPNIAADWLKFRVHGGRYMGTIVAGTDGYDVDPSGTGYPSKTVDSDTIPDEADVTDISVPSGLSVPFWFWIDSSSGPAIKYGYTSSPAGAGAGGDPILQGWSSFPNADASHTPIGYVDTVTQAADHFAIIRQIVRTDIIAGGGTGAPVWLP